MSITILSKTSEEHEVSAVPQAFEGGSQPVICPQEATTLFE